MSDQEDDFLCMRRVRQAIAAMKARPVTGDIDRLRELARQLREAAHSADGAADGLIAEVMPCDKEQRP